MSSLFLLLAMKFSSSLCQILGWSLFVRVDGVSYSFLGDEALAPGGPLNGSVNSTNVVVTPTQTVVTAQAGPMQVNLTFLNPIEVCLHYTILCYIQCLTCAPSKAWRLGQAIHPIFVYGFHRKIIGRRKTCCAGVFRR